MEHVASQCILSFQAADLFEPDGIFVVLLVLLGFGVLCMGIHRLRSLADSRVYSCYPSLRTC